MMKCALPSAATTGETGGAEVWSVQPPTAVNPTRPRWMVVDDDPGILKFLPTIVSALAKVETRSFGSAVEALKAFEAAPDRFDAVVTDLDMPGMSGLEFCRRLRLLSPDLKVLLITGSGLVTLDEALAFGFCGLVAKPFSLQTLNRALDSSGMMEL